MKWTEEETLIAMYYYLQYYRKRGQTTLATEYALPHLDRTIGSVKRKFANFASLDPLYVGKGLFGHSNLDAEIWKEYIESPGKVTKKILSVVENLDVMVHDEGEYSPDYAMGGEIIRSVKTRVGQAFFRKSVVGNFGNSCCLTGITDQRLLRASHIKPWRVCNGFEKTDPCNGLCLNSLHDTAFDKGLMTIVIEESKDDQPDITRYRVEFSKNLSNRMPDETYRRHFLPYQGKIISRGIRYEMGEAYLDYHRNNIFIQKA